MKMSEKQLLENIKNGCSTVTKTKNVKKVHKIKKAPIKYEMVEQKGVCGMVATPALHIPPKNKNKKTKL